MMEQQHADQGHRKFWSLMASMTWKERITHILFYYGKYALLIAVLLYIAGDILWEMYREKPEEIFRGTAINVHVSADLQDALTEEAFPHVGGEDTEKQEIKLVPNEVTAANLHFISNLHTKLLAGEYDYVLMDQTALNVLAPMNAFPDLNLLLPEETLEHWNERFAYVRTDGVDAPVAINITGTPLAEGCTFDSEYIYIAFPVNIDRAYVVEPFFDYLSQELLPAPK